MIKYTIEGSIAKILLNRPDKFNSFNFEMALQLQEALKKCSDDENIRCVFITGEGKAFSAGQDLSEAMTPGGLSINERVEKQYNPIILGLRNLEKPVVCAVNGVAAGAGANIALACDIVVAGKSSSFLQAFCKIGLIPDSGGTFFLPRLIGLPRATALTMLGEKISADEAYQYGMIYKVVEDAELAEESWKIAITLAEMPTRGLGLTKMLLNKTWNNSLEEQLVEEGKHQAKAGDTYDFKEGVKAFLEKRKPEFKGK